MGWMVPLMVEAAHQGDEVRLLAALIAQDSEQRSEFKILRGGYGAFRDTAAMQAILDEEARAQWGMVAKLDDERIVLRRPREARARDVLLSEGIDPYRTQIRTQGRSAVIAGLLFFLALGIAVAIVSGASAGAGDIDNIGPVAAVVAIVLVVIGVIAAIARRR